MGDPAGIGPEIAVKGLAHKKTGDLCLPIIFGDAGVIKQAVSISGRNLDIYPIEEISKAKFEPGLINVFDLKNVDNAALKPGVVSPEAGAAAFEAIKAVIDYALKGEIAATVTCPMHKEALNLAGYKFAGHTEIYAHLTNTKDYAMLLVEQNLRIVHVSTHTSLRRACDLVKKQRIIKVIELGEEVCKKLGIANPRIGVAGLNPHASDGGLFGLEEKDEIIPAIETAKASGINVQGPVPADTLFAKAKGGSYDLVVAMYHDQGHIPLKLLGFNWNEKEQKWQAVTGVNITLGLPIIRTSVDHGTAFDIAGKGVASEKSLLMAIEYAVKLAGAPKH